MKNIYALYFLEDEIKRYFYVGQSNDVPRRIAEHIRAVPEGHENKYERLRQLNAQGVPWDVEILREIPSGEYPLDNERWFVIDLTRKGHELTNMRHGSAERRRDLARQVHAIHIRSVEDVACERLHGKAADQVRKHGASRRLRHRIFKSTLRTQGFANLQSDNLMPPRLRARLLREGVDSIEEGVDQKFLLRIARPDQARKDFKAFVLQVEQANPEIFERARKLREGTGANQVASSPTFGNGI